MSRYRTCNADLVLEAEFDFETGEFKGFFTGSLCGHQVQIDALKFLLE